jgi:oligoendopeptidase F
MHWQWAEIEPFYIELQARNIHASSVDQWLIDWSRVSEHVAELYWRLYAATTINTADSEAEALYKNYFDNLYPHAQTAEQHLKEKLLASGLEPAGFEMPLRNMRAEAALFRAENLPLIAEENKLNNDFDRLIGSRTVQWDGADVTLQQLDPIFYEADRSRREQAWMLSAERRLVDRAPINDLWRTLIGLRGQMSANAGKPNPVAYFWDQKLRFDYTPADCRAFHDAIEKVAVPAAQRVYEKRRKRLGIESVRPWDVNIDPFQRPPLKPYASIDALQQGAARILEKVDPVLGGHFRTMISERLLDLDNRKDKAGGAYCASFDAIRRPFIFCNSVGLHDDVQTLLHECGHAFHTFETAHIPYYHLINNIPMEFLEVASTAMELLSTPYLEESGMYTRADSSQALIEHLEGILRFWPYVAVVDAFQHWVYAHPRQSVDPDQCDEQWSALWDRFMIGLDYSGLEQIKRSRWQWQLHIVQSPFYYIEYGLSMLGAVQVWANARKDQAGAVRAYRRALALGGSVNVPDLYAAAGVKFAFDAGTLGAAVDLIEEVLESAESI